MTQPPSNPILPALRADARDDNPQGALTGLQRHNAGELAAGPSIVIDSILPDSPSDDELKGAA